MSLFIPHSYWKIADFWRPTQYRSWNWSIVAWWLTLFLHILGIPHSNMVPEASCCYWGSCNCQPLRHYLKMGYNRVSLHRLQFIIHGRLAVRRYCWGAWLYSCTWQWRLHKRRYFNPWALKSIHVKLSLWALRSGDRIALGARISTHVQTDPGAHPASFKMGTSFLPGGKPTGPWR